MDVALAVLAFIGGLLAKPLADLSAELVKQLVSRKQANTDKALAQADSASERCWEALAVLANDLPRHIQNKRLFFQDYPGREEVEEQMVSTQALLEANVELLHPDAREPMRRVVDILAATKDIESASGAPFAHYDPAYKMVTETARYGRQVLGAQLRREKVPPIPSKFYEYLVAMQEADEFWAEKFSEPDDMLRMQPARELWLQRHQTAIEKVRNADD